MDLSLLTRRFYVGFPGTTRQTPPISGALNAAARGTRKKIRKNSRDQNYTFKFELNSRRFFSPRLAPLTAAL